MDIELPRAPGSFSHEFAEKKAWKTDEGLLAALLHVIPKGASVVDLGAGVGKYVLALREAGCPALGVDGIPGIEELSDGCVLERDLTRPVYLDPVDWVISIEVGEHIKAGPDREYLQNLIRAARKGMVISWAIPGQRGRDHVNCHSPEWVVEMVKIFDQAGVWYFNELRTQEARKLAGKGWDRKLLVFTRLGILDAARSTSSGW